MRWLPRITHLVVLQAITLACGLQFPATQLKHEPARARQPGPTTCRRSAHRIGVTTERRTCWSAPASAARRRRSKRLAKMTPAQGGARIWCASRASTNSQLPPFDHSGILDPGTRAVSAQPPRGDRPGQGKRRSAGHQGQARRATGACSRSSTSSSTGCAPARSRPAASPTGGPTACSPAQRPLEEKMALFWHGHFATNEDKVRDYRKTAAAARAVPEARHRQFPRPADRRRAGPGDAGVPGRGRERQGRIQRELRARDHGAVHHGRGQLHREGHPRGGARLHRLELRRPQVRR